MSESTGSAGGMAEKAYSDGQQTGRQVKYERKAALKKEKKQAKDAKPEKPGSANKAGSADPGAPKGGGGIGGVIAVLAVLLVTVSLAFGLFLVFYMDLGGVKTYVSELILNEDEFYATRLAELEVQVGQAQAMQATLSAQSSEYDAKLAELAERERKLDKRSAELDSREAKLKLREQDLVTHEGEQDQLIATLSNVDAAAAAKMLEAMEDKNSVARMLAKMDVKKAAAILENMSTDVSSTITQLMLPEAQSAIADETEND